MKLLRCCAARRSEAAGRELARTVRRSKVSSRGWPGDESREASERVRASFVPDTELGESPLWPAAAVVTAALLYVTLPERFIVGRGSQGFFGDIRWIVLGMTTVLLAALLLTFPHGLDERTLGRGRASAARRPARSLAHDHRRAHSGELGLDLPARPRARERRARSSRHRCCGPQFTCGASTCSSSRSGSGSSTAAAR